MYVSPFSFDAQRGTISAVQRTLILKTFPGFASLSAEQLATLAAICHERFFAAGQSMLQPGKPVAAFYQVVEGNAAIRRNGEQVQTMGPRSAVGGLAALTADPQGADVAALTDVLALEVDAFEMNELFEDNFAIALGVIMAMARTIRNLQMALGRPLVPSAIRAESNHPQELSLVDKVLILRNARNLVIDEVEALSVLAARCSERRFRKGERVWSTGDTADSSWLLFEGKLSCQQPGREPYVVGPGWLAGAQDATAMKPRYYNADACSDGRALLFSRDAFFDMLEDYSDIAHLTLKTMAQAVTELLDALASPQTKPADKP